MVKQIGQLLSARLTSFVAALFFAIATSQAVAQTLTPAEEAAKNKVLEQEEAKSRVAIYGWVESGFTGNVDDPSDHLNFGRLFDDRSNKFVMNQAVITAERVLDPKIGFDWGFKLQLMFGTDARFIHSLGMGYHRAGTGLYQTDIPEAYVSLHSPLLTEGGIDVKLGKFVTLEGAETIDPRTNAFYSHTYIFNFGIPFNHTGALFTLHTTSWLDLIGGVTRGVNTSIDDNNDSAAFDGGIGLNFNEGKLVVLASTHIGPETFHDDSALRYLNDVAITWKIAGKLTSITDINYTHDDGADASAYGVAQYLTCVINDRITAKIRGEIWRDAQGFYAAQFADPGDPLRVLGGVPAVDPRTVGGGRTTYGALTIGLDLKPPVPKPLTGLTIRPELRVDHSFSDTRPFNDSSDDTMFTAAIDVIMTF
jgi:putative OmpL-like beta-barrel porin-2